MKYCSYLVLLSGAMLIGLFVACDSSSQAPADTFAAGNMGGATTGGSAGGATTGNSDRATTGSTSSTSTTKTSDATGGGPSIFTLATGGSTNTLPEASDTEDGTVQVSAEKAAEALKNPETTCQGWSVEAESEGSIILFLVDVSGSMLESAPSTGGKSKWEVTRSALKAAIQRFPSSVAIGISFFPNLEIIAETKNARPVESCVDTSRDVAIDALTKEHKNAVLSALDGIEPYQKAATPTHDAITVAYNQLKNTSLSGRRYLVFITDGQPTQSQGCLGTGIMCQPSPVEPILETISVAQSGDHVSTFVVGSPGSEKNYCTDADVRGWLSQAARVGNTAGPDCKDDAAPYCHFDLSAAEDFGTAMSDALSEITKSIISCNYAVPQSPEGGKLDPSRVNIIFNNGEGDYYLLLPNTGGTCEKGWNYTDSNNSMVQICSDTCNVLQDNPAAKLSILFGCKGGVMLL